MPVYEYHQLPLNISEQDSEYYGYFQAARDHKLVLRKCLDCGLLRGEPGPACPWCASMDWEWNEVSGRGTIYSYQIVAHSVMPGFREWVPYPIVLVELDEQRGRAGFRRRAAHHREPDERGHAARRRAERRYRQARPRRFSRYRGRPDPPAIHSDGRTAGGRTLALSGIVNKNRH